MSVFIDGIPIQTHTPFVTGNYLNVVAPVGDGVTLTVIPRPIGGGSGGVGGGG